MNVYILSLKFKVNIVCYFITTYLLYYQNIIRNDQILIKNIIFIIYCIIISIIYITIITVL